MPLDPCGRDAARAIFLEEPFAQWIVGRASPSTGWAGTVLGGADRHVGPPCDRRGRRSSFYAADDAAGYRSPHECKPRTFSAYLSQFFLLRQGIRRCVRSGRIVCHVAHNDLAQQQRPVPRPRLPFYAGRASPPGSAGTPPGVRNVLPRFDRSRMSGNRT